MKKWQIGLIVAAVLLIAIGTLVWVRLNPATVDAQVVYKSGTVLVNGQPIQANKELREGDTIATQAGQATVIVQEAAFVNLAADTSLTLTDLNSKHAKVDQTAGSSTITFVKGTKLQQLDITQDGITREVTGTFLSVSGALTYVQYGMVGLRYGNTIFHIQDDSIYFINIQTGQVTNRKMSDAEKNLIKSEIVAARDTIIAQRLAEIEKSPEVVVAIEKVSGLPKEALLTKLAEYDTKTIADINEIRSRAPFVTRSMDRVGSYTAEIQELNRYLNK